jgi:hypothetical protein
MMRNRHSWRRRAVGLALATAGMLLASVFASPAALAHDGSITCLAGVVHQEFSPAVEPAPHQVSVHQDGVLFGCVSLSHPDIVGGTWTYQGQGNLSCITGGNSEGTYTFHWVDANGNPEGTTVADWATIAVTVRPDGQNLAVGIGPTTGGTHMHPGYMVLETLLLANPLACLTTGVEEQDGVMLGLTIT